MPWATNTPHPPHLLPTHSMKYSGYGYKFLRINRFNCGKDPVAVLGKRLHAVIEARPEANGVLDVVLETIDGLRTNEVKECPKCKQLRDIEDFRDLSLVRGIGRICLVCKGMRIQKEMLAQATQILSLVKCPLCSANMVLRRSKYGQFYSCIKYPRCKGKLLYKFN